MVPVFLPTCKISSYSLEINGGSDGSGNDAGLDLASISQPEPDPESDTLKNFDFVFDAQFDYASKLERVSINDALLVTLAKKI